MSIKKQENINFFKKILNFKNLLNINNLKLFLANNWIVILIWSLSTFFFIIQHYFTRPSWDFSVYWMNGLHFLGKGTYFEVGRPPLVPIVMAFFSFFGNFGDYFFVIFTSLLFAFSSVKLAKSSKLNEKLFYLLSVMPFTLLYGLFDGTELFSLALIELFLVTLFSFRKSGHWIGFSGLARYTNLSLVSLLIFSKSVKQFFINVFLFVLTMSPWFLFNRFFHSNYFQSIAESYALNVKFRDYIVPHYDFSFMFKTMNILFVFFIIGFVYVFYNLIIYFKKSPLIKFKQIFTKVSIQRNDIIIILLALITIKGFIDVPLKDSRYLFNLIVPSVYLFMRFIVSFKNDKLKKIINLAIIVLFIFIQIIFIFTSWPTLVNYSNSVSNYNEAISRINELNLNNCKIMSDEWPLLNYFGKRTEPLPPREDFNYYLKNGFSYVVFHSFPRFEKPNPDDPSFKIRDDYFVLEENLDHPNLVYFSSRYAIFGNSSLCNYNGTKYVNSYFNSLNRNYLLHTGEPLDYDPCNVLFDKSILLQKICYMVNFINNR